MGHQNIVILKKDGRIISWGRNTNNQLNFSFTTGVKDIAIDEGTSMILTNNGSAYYYGSSVYGNAPSVTTGIKKIFNEDANFGYLTINNRLYSVGRNTYTLNNSDIQNREVVDYLKKNPFNSSYRDNFILDASGDLYVSIFPSGLKLINSLGQGESRVSGMTYDLRSNNIFAIDHRNRLFRLETSFTGLNLFYYVQDPIKNIAGIFLLTGTF
jgi:hypothetical protein